MPIPHPELNGHIYHVDGNPDIYWIDGGLARHIVDEPTYHGVFGDSPHNETNDLLGEIEVGVPLGAGTMLIRAANWKEIYLLDQHKKRFITSPAAKSGYQLNGHVHGLSPYVVESIPDGTEFEVPHLVR